MSPISRRRFLAATGAIVVSAAANAETKPKRIGCLFGGSPTTHRQALEAFRAGLKEYGWIEGRDVIIELHWAEGRMDRVPSLAAELVQSRPDVILTAANPVILEIKKATQSIPIIMATGSDPVGSGLVASMSRPGGNLTGLSGFYESTPVKMLELASALVPRGAQVAAIVEAKTVFSRGRYHDEFVAAANTLDLRTPIHEIASVDDLANVLDLLSKSKPAALIVLPGPMIFALARDFVGRAERLSIPVIYPFEEMAEAGGLMSYASNLLDSYRRAARYVDRVLRGANPSDLPIEQPTRLWLTINLRTAKGQGVRIPPAILSRADRIIE